MESFNFGMMRPDDKPNEIVDTIFSEGLEHVIDGVRSWPGYEKIAQKMQPLTVSTGDDTLSSAIQS